MVAFTTLGVVGGEWNGPGDLLPVLAAMPVCPMGVLPLPAKGNHL